MSNKKRGRMRIRGECTGERSSGKYGCGVKRGKS